jgi:hypothetical protein
MEKVTKDLRRTPFANTAARAVPSGVEATAEATCTRIQPPSPIAPQWSIAQEAQEAVAREVEAPAGLDYGREISLPGESAPRPKAVAAAAGIPAAPRRAAPPTPAEPAPAAQTAVVTLDAAQSAAGVITVPVTLTPGAAREIVLRIVLKIES